MFLVSYPCNSFAVDSLARDGLSACPYNYEAEALSFVNTLRMQKGLSPLRANRLLMESSGKRAGDMSQAESLTHAGWKESIHKAGYANYAIGENIARGHETPYEVVEAWYLSAGHRENIMYKGYTITGIGCRRDKDGSFWWTQQFAGEAVR